jgi:hypothetical protein
MAVLRRGFRVLVDTLDLEAGLRESAARPSPRSPPDQAAFAQLTHDFRYHLLWAAKKLRRGELWVATQACNCHLGGLLVTLLGWHTAAAQPLADAWHGGRFLERWADPQVLGALGDAYAGYDAAEVAAARAPEPSAVVPLPRRTSPRREGRAGPSPSTTRRTSLTADVRWSLGTGWRVGVDWRWPRRHPAWQRRN